MVVQTFFVWISYIKPMKTKFLINGQTRLFGEVKVDGAKNAFLPILAACVLCDGVVELENYVDLTDLVAMQDILQEFGIKCQSFDGVLQVDCTNVSNARITRELSQKVRASIFVLGAMLGRFESAVIAYPGGCNIGARPIDIHINSFKKLGAKIVERHGYIYCNSKDMQAGTVVLDFPSVGATESLMMCACVLSGKTVLKNVAKEPEIEDLQNFLNAMGANVSGAGSDEIQIEGVKSLHGARFCVMPDRIVAGTYLLATAVCGGDVLVKDAYARHNQSLLSFLKQTACQIETYGDRIRVKADKRLSSISKIKTLPYPFFPTDLQAPMTVLQAVSQGTCILQETLFENRFLHVGELCKMGAKITTHCQSIVISGVETLYGAEVCAGDLRAGAALVLAGMQAEGYTTVENVHLIDRGYKSMEEKYNLLGAQIKRIEID